MSNEKWNDIWKHLKSGRLEFVDKVNNNVLCIICKKVLINAHSGPCGCRYCLECITNYLNGEEKICPGNTNDCKKELININSNVLIEQAMNIKISKLIVKCPQEICQFRDELRNLENHMRICDSRSVECPYVIMGCNFVDTDLKKHMLMEIVPHTKLIFEFIDNLKKEIQVLKEDKIKVKRNKKDIEKYIQEFQLKYENDYEDMKKSISDSKLKYENDSRKIKEKIKELQNKCEEVNIKGQNEMKREVKIIKDDLYENKKSISDSKLRCENEINELKKKIKELENKCEEVKINGHNEMKGEVKMIKDDLCKNKKSIRDSKLNCENDKKEIKERINELENKCNEVKRLCGGEFVLRIDKWREKMEQARVNIVNRDIISESFYSHTNGYKMCLVVWPNGSGYGRETHLSIYCYVMRGECDDILPWPSKHDVTFELINQHTKQIHTSSTVTCSAQYDRDSGIYYYRDNRKPKEINESNLICYNEKFVSLKELSNDNDRSLIHNDQIFIRCKVHKIN